MTQISEKNFRLSLLILLNLKFYLGYFQTLNSKKLFFLLPILLGVRTIKFRNIFSAVFLIAVFDIIQLQFNSDPKNLEYIQLFLKQNSFVDTVNEEKYIHILPC